jgi:hypothetical protein
MNKNLPLQNEQPQQPVVEMIPPQIQDHVEVVPADVIPQKSEIQTAHAAPEAVHRAGSLAVEHTRQIPAERGTHGFVAIAKPGGGFTQYRM